MTNFEQLGYLAARSFLAKSPSLDPAYQIASAMITNGQDRMKIAKEWYQGYEHYCDSQAKMIFYQK